MGSSVCKASKAIIVASVHKLPCADGEPKAVLCIYGRSVIVKATEGSMPCIQEADASLLWGHGADTGNTTRDTLL
jgi:hypothetical protein